MPEDIKKRKTRKVSVKKTKKETPDLKSIIIEGIREKNGGEIVIIDFKNISGAICDYFIICQGSSNRQVETIAEGIERAVRKTIGIKPFHKEGTENAQWVLLDYLDIVVHIFQPETRNFYRLEDLWADAEQLKIEN